MHRAIDKAREAWERGEVPVGAVVTLNGELIAEAQNFREQHQDPTAHAELLAMRRAADYLGSWRLEHCTVYVTLEPCAMCCGALINARVPKLVYGADDPKAGCVQSLYHILDDERFNHLVEVNQSPLADTCGDLLTNFFEAVRKGEAPPKPGSSN